MGPISLFRCHIFLMLLVVLTSCVCSKQGFFPVLCFYKHPKSVCFGRHYLLVYWSKRVIRSHMCMTGTLLIRANFWPRNCSWSSQVGRIHTNPRPEIWTAYYTASGEQLLFGSRSSITCMQHMLHRALQNRNTVKSFHHRQHEGEDVNGIIVLSAAGNFSSTF